jgi:ferritin-like metal-binding protein YciE
METARELFTHELADMLDAEKKLLDALAEMAEQSQNKELRKGFEQHREQTAEQVQRLEQVFEELGESPESTECKGLKGLIEEQKSFAEEDPSPEILDVFNIGAAEKVESYEMRAYESLISLAKDLGLRRTSQLLARNLKEEEQTLKKLQTLSRKIKPSQSGMQGEEEEEITPSRRSRKGRRAA